MRIFPILIFLCLIGLIANAQLNTNNYLQDNSTLPREHSLDFIKLRLEVSFEPANGLVKGRVTHYFTPLRPSVESFFLDGIKMNVKQIVLNGKPVPFTLDSLGVTVSPAKALTWNTLDSLTITYEATPRKGLYFIGWNDEKNQSKKQIWTQGEMLDNRHWIPMYDERNDKLISELFINFPSGYQVLSNGKMVDLKKNNDGTSTWHYLMSHPQSVYLIMLGIGQYGIKETHSASGVPMHLYYYPEWKNRVEVTYQHSEAMLDFFEKEIGIAYPWESYSQIPVQDYMFGAMENTTATVFGDFYMVDSHGVLDRNYIAVNAHELAHQWFGDDVTALSDAHQWLQEGFATYYNQLFEKEVFGEDYFGWSRRGSQNGSIEESLKNKFGIAHSEAGGARIYGKGAFVLNMLKYVVGGREIYNKAIKHYLQKHAYQNVDSHDLQIAFEETTGMSLQWFWDQWILRGGEPAYSVSFNEKGSQREMVIQQTQGLTSVTGYQDGLYKMPIWIAVYYSDGTSDKKQYWIQKQTEIISLPENSKKIDFVLFDPGNEILKTVTFVKPLSSLQSQALKAPAMLDRYDAVVALRSYTSDQKLDVLIKAYTTEKLFPVKAEVVTQLSNDPNPRSLSLLKDALINKDAAVRKAVLRNVNPVTSGLLPEFEKLLSDSSYEIVEIALTKLAALNFEKAEKYLSITKGIEGNLGKNVLVRWLEIAYQTTSKKEYAEQLVSLTSHSYEFRTRGNAMAALRRLAYCSDELFVNLVEASFSANNRLSNPALDLLKFFYSQNKYRKTISTYIASQHLLRWQTVILKANGF